jgi:hypothetical protein
MAKHFILGQGIVVIEFVIECNERIFAFIRKRQLKRNAMLDAFDAGIP